MEKGSQKQAQKLPDHVFKYQMLTLASTTCLSLTANCYVPKLNSGRRKMLTPTLVKAKCAESSDCLSLLRMEVASINGF